jgi:hypothetical protein
VTGRDDGYGRVEVAWNAKVLRKMIERAQRQHAQGHLAPEQRGGHGADRAVAPARDHRIDVSACRGSLGFVVELVPSDAADVGVDAGRCESIARSAFRRRGRVTSARA